MEIKMTEGKACVYTPYNPDFVKKVKGIGGAKWDGSRKCWVVPETAAEAVREIMVDVYGYSDMTENKTVSLRVTFNRDAIGHCCDVVLFGKVMAHASGRDSGAKVGDGVAYVRGGAGSGGSAKNWCSIVEEGSVAILSGVNESLYKKGQTEYDVTVEELNEHIDRQALVLERDRLIKRIAEIDSLLERNGG